MTTVKQPIKLTLTVKRPDGTVEKVIHPKFKSISDTQFKQIQRDTKAAGRGEVLSYDITYKVTPVLKTSSDIFHAGVESNSDVIDAMTLNGKTY